MTPNKNADGRAGRLLRALASRLTGGGAGRKAAAAAAILIAAAVCVLAVAAATLPMERILRRPSSLVVTDMRGTPLRGSLSSDGEWTLPVPLSEMGRWMPAAAVAIEDRRFYAHRGVDWLSIARAAWQNVSEGRVVSGASTITSQVVRLAEERPRTIPNKFIEFAQAAALELFLTKNEILEIYLNSVPFGGNTRGVEAAARTWFGKPAKNLSLAEAALFTALLRGPAFYRPDRHPERARELRDRLIDTLAERGVATEEEARRAKLEPLPTARRDIAGTRIQAAEMAAKMGAARDNLDRYGRFRSTLDADKENLLLAELRAAVAQTGGGVTAAAVLVENKTAKVRGYIGNAREGTGAEAAWVDCAASPRSPGSALKPFIYALAFERGLAAPETMIADVPDGGGSAGVRNYDRLYRGPVTARAALCDSLNVPAVKMFRAAGAENVLGLFRRLGFSSLTKEASWYGDSLALGGCEVSPLELARAYRTLASGGRDAPLVWNEDAEAPEGTPVLSEAAAALVLDIMKDARRSLPAYAGAANDGKIVAFKTGTSYGLRDAWTAAVTPEWTLVVWLGDPTGRPRPNLTGLTAAAPAAARIMLRLTRKNAPWFRLPASVVRKELCPLSGAPRGQWCPQTKEGLVIKNVTDSEPCRLHALRGGEVKILWPEELALFFASRGAPRSPARLTITSPRDGAAYTLSENSGRLVLSSAGGDGTVYWFADGEYIGASDDGRGAAWTMTPGGHLITAACEDGSTAKARIEVKDPRAPARELPPLEALE